MQDCTGAEHENGRDARCRASADTQVRCRDLRPSRPGLPFPGDNLGRRHGGECLVGPRRDASLQRLGDGTRRGSCRGLDPQTRTDETPQGQGDLRDPHLATVAALPGPVLLPCPSWAQRAIVRWQPRTGLLPDRGRPAAGQGLIENRAERVNIGRCRWVATPGDLRRDVAGPELDSRIHQPARARRCRERDWVLGPDKPYVYGPTGASHQDVLRPYPTVDDTGRVERPEGTR
jgi:hypothetical protein